VDKLALAAAWPERPGRCNTDVAPGVTSCSADGPESKESKDATADSEKNLELHPGIRFVAFSRRGIQLTDLRSILTGLLVNLRPTMIRGLMTDEEWAIFAPFLTTASLRGGRPPMNHRHRLDGILWICRTGAPWRDLPAAFGKWNSVWKQFRRWCESGVWDLLLQALADSGGKRCASPTLR